MCKYWLVMPSHSPSPVPSTTPPHTPIITLTNPMYTFTHSQHTHTGMHTHTHSNTDQKPVAPAALLSHLLRVHKTNLRILSKGDPIFCSRSANQAKSVFPIPKLASRTTVNEWCIWLVIFTIPRARTNKCQQDEKKSVIVCAKTIYFFCTNWMWMQSTNTVLTQHHRFTSLFKHCLFHTWGVVKKCTIPSLQFSPLAEKQRVGEKSQKLWSSHPNENTTNGKVSNLLKLKTDSNISMYTHICSKLIFPWKIQVAIKIIKENPQWQKWAWQMWRNFYRFWPEPRSSTAIDFSTVHMPV